MTQVLNDGTNQYLYGAGRIAQVNTETEYFLGDALGSVRQLTDATGEITYASAYDPYGVPTQAYGASQTSYGFTGEFTDPSGMMYLRARYYMPNDGRFLTRDTWMGDYNRPLSLNRWMYTEGNPVNYTDPSGLCGKPGEPPCPPGRRQNGAVPDWWSVQTQIYVEGLGYFDSGHLGRGWDTAEWLVLQIKAALDSDEEYKNEVSRRYDGMLPLARALSNGTPYWVDYVVSARITDGQIYGVAYGIYMDFERGYEEYQSSKIFPLNLSGFAPADLPSDHLGFWAYFNEYERDEIPTLLQCLGEVEVLFPQLWGITLDSTGIAENHEFLPMIREPVFVRSSKGYRTRNIAWPAFLEIQPIPSGPNTWQVWNRSH